MIILQIEHPVPDFEGWKNAFENDPMDRAASGVKSHRVSRLSDNPNYVIIELEFVDINEAAAMLGKLQSLWKKVDGKVMTDPKTKIFEVVDSKIY